MDYASTQRNAKKHLIGFTGVVLLHVFIIYALVTGMASKMVKVMVKPLETKIIEEFIPPPPPPPPPPPKKIEKVMPKVDAPPPPPYVPPPEVVVQAPAPPVISTVTQAPPVVEPVIAPPPPPTLAIAPPAPPAPPPPAPKPKVRTGVTPTKKEECTYPRDALRKGVPGGDFMTLLNVDEKGNVTNVEVLEGRRTDGFERELKRCLLQWKFEADGDKYQVKAPFEFKLTEQ
jgi:protein TonB